HLETLLSIAPESLGQGPPDTVGALHRPAALRPAARPLAQLLVTLQGGGDALLAEQLAVLIQCGGGVGGLVRVDPNGDEHPAPFSRSEQERTGEGRPTWGRDSPRGGPC